MKWELHRKDGGSRVQASYTFNIKIGPLLRPSLSSESGHQENAPPRPTPLVFFLRRVQRVYTTDRESNVITASTLRKQAYSRGEMHSANRWAMQTAKDSTRVLFNKRPLQRSAGRPGACGASNSRSMYWF